MKTTSVFLTDALSDRYGRPRSKCEELQLRIENLRARAGWCDRDEAAELEAQIAEVERELAALGKDGDGR
jgi:hypothetical protein